MKWRVVLLVVGVVAASCGPTAQQHRSARVEALQFELDSVLEAWQTDVTRGYFRTSADAAQTLASRYDTVYARWGLRPDVLTQATMAYARALAARVDRRDLSADAANALLSRMRGDLDPARSVLTGRHNGDPAAREAAMMTWWNEYWSSHRQTYQVTAGNPVTCEGAPPGSIICH